LTDASGPKCVGCLTDASGPKCVGYLTDASGPKHVGCLTDASGPKCMGNLTDALDSEGKDLLGKQHWIQKGKDSTSGSEQEDTDTGPEMVRISWTA
jgi:hypothetical protein